MLAGLHCKFYIDDKTLNIAYRQHTVFKSYLKVIRATPHLLTPAKDPV